MQISLMTLNRQIPSLSCTGSQASAFLSASQHSFLNKYKTLQMGAQFSPKLHFEAKMIKQEQNKKYADG